MGASALLDGLNPPQREAVEAPDGPLLIFAGAGSGKTRVLTQRIAYVIATRRVRPDEICAVTFTNKAAREMRARVEQLIGDSIKGMWLGTFHSLGARLLRREGDAIGIPPGYTIYDESDRLAAMRNAIRAEGIDEKRLTPNRAAHAISAAKNELLNARDFQERATSTIDEQIARIYFAYENALDEASALDFDDLLLRAVVLLREVDSVREYYQDRFLHLFVDEYQDTNKAQYELVKILAAKHRNVTVVGDDDQCLAAGTLIRMADGSERHIEDVRPGDCVMSGYGSGTFRGAQVVDIRSRVADCTISVHTARGRTLTSTPEHTHFAGHHLGTTPQTYFTYLMQKNGTGFRIGTSQVHTNGQVKPVVGYRQRSQQEHADALWIVSTHNSENEARAEESILSLQYQIPTLPFVPRRGRGTNGLVHDKASIDRVFAAVVEFDGGRRLLADRNLSLDYPHYRPRSRNSSRRRVVITLCGDRRGATPMHRIGIGGNDAEGRATLERLGLSIRPSKAAGGWRFETCRKSFGEVMQVARRIREVMDVEIALTACLGGNATGRGQFVTTLPFTPAASLLPGMVVFDEHGGVDVVEKIERSSARQTVYDIDVEPTHNLIANGLVTHNSIYGFRGADVRNILSFERDFPDAKTVTLEQNYRSTQPILDIAHSVIQNNAERAAKRLWTEQSVGEPVRLISVYDEREEALAVGSEIENLIGREGVSLAECAVLYRTNAQSRAFEEVFLRRGIPYQLVGGLRFYDRREVKDVLAYLRLCVNPRDAVSFARVVNTPRRKIGDRSVAELEKLARKQGLTPLEAAQRLDKDDAIGPAAMAALHGFAGLMERLSADAQRVPVTVLLERVLEETGYREMLQDGTQEGAERWANVLELAGLAGEYADVPAPDGLVQFLENVALVSDVDTMREDAPGVTLITLHMVKGLEFGVVFIAGMEEGLLPHSRALEEGDAGIAEERRLTYVGITRARRRLYLLHAFRRHLYGSAQLAEASRFLGEIPREMLEVALRPGAPSLGDIRSPGTVRRAVIGYATRPNPVEIAPQRFNEGMRIGHDLYGEGTVLKSTMTRAGEELVIKFDEHGVKIFAVADARLWPLVQS
jgi:DNA helicase-2/ATP-dependent DNA helicase PcrA